MVIAIVSFLNSEYLETGYICEANGHPIFSFCIDMNWYFVLDYIVVIML